MASGDINRGRYQMRNSFCRTGRLWDDLEPRTERERRARVSDLCEKGLLYEDLLRRLPSVLLEGMLSRDQAVAAVVSPAPAPGFIPAAHGKVTNGADSARIMSEWAFDEPPS